MLGTHTQWPNPDLTRRFSVVLGMQPIESEIEIAIHSKQLEKPELHIPQGWGVVNMPTEIPFDATKSLARQIAWLSKEAPDLVEDWLLHRMALTCEARNTIKEKLKPSVFENLEQLCLSLKQ